MTSEAVLDLVASRSYVITMDPLRRAMLLERVQGLLSAHPDTAGRARFPMPYVALCFRTTSAGGHDETTATAAQATLAPGTPLKTLSMKPLASVTAKKPPTISTTTMMPMMIMARRLLDLDGSSSSSASRVP